MKKITLLFLVMLFICYSINAQNNKGNPKKDLEVTLSHFEESGTGFGFDLNFSIRNNTNQSISILKPYGLSYAPPEFFSLEFHHDGGSCFYSFLGKGFKLKQKEDIVTIAPNAIINFTIDSDNFKQGLCDESIKEIKVVLKYKPYLYLFEEDQFMNHYSNYDLAYSIKKQFFNKFQKTYQKEFQSDTLIINGFNNSGKPGNNIVRPIEKGAEINMQKPLIDIETEHDNNGVFTDVRDGQDYDWKRMRDGRRWITRNLNYKTQKSWCYDDNPTNCEKYGRLYSWEAGKSACPDGWRLPNDEDWNQLYRLYGGDNTVENDNGRKDAFDNLTGYSIGFEALRGGYRNDDGIYKHHGRIGSYWCNSEYDNNSGLVYSFRQDPYLTGLFKKYAKKESGFSCRCIQDDELTNKIQDKLAWEKAHSIYTISAFELYLSEFPNGNYSDNAQTKIEELKIAASTLSGRYGIFIDSRDGQHYAWKRMMDGRKWMTKNLNFETQESWCYDNNPYNCKKYGRLYTWNTAKEACPVGWRLPSGSEWEEMVKYYGGSNTPFLDDEEGQLAYFYLINGGSGGLAAIHGGDYNTDSKGSFGNLNEYGSYWSRTEIDEENVLMYYFYYSGILFRNYSSKTLGLNCRCIQDDKETIQHQDKQAWEKADSIYTIIAFESYLKDFSHGEYVKKAQAEIVHIKNTPFGIYSDKRDGKEYTWRRMRDGRKWMTQNLNYITQESWCYDDSLTNCEKYGRLYTWRAAKRSCPDGWQLPSEEDWENLKAYYKSKDSIFHFLLKDKEMGFYAKPGGIRDYPSGNYKFLGDKGFYWLSSKYDRTSALKFSIKDEDHLIDYHLEGYEGSSCRCINKSE